jgi:hypothetical protein
MPGAFPRASESHAAHAAHPGGEATSPAAQAAQPARKSPQTSRPKDGTVSGWDFAFVFSVAFVVNAIE